MRTRLSGLAAGLACILLAPAAAAQQAAPAPRTPTRVIALAPNLTELVYAAGAGDRLIGAVAFSDYPAAARTLPRVGDALRVDAERMLMLRPDLVLTWRDGTSAETLSLLARLGLPSLELGVRRLDDVPLLLESLGRRFGTEPVAGAAAARFRTAIRTLGAAHLAAPRLRVFYQVWDAPLYTLGAHHVVTELLDLCGGANVFASDPSVSFAVDLESVYARDPDVIVLAGSAREQAHWLRAWRSRPALRAVAGGAVVGVDPDLANRMGPRLAAGAAALCAALDGVRAGALASRPHGERPNPDNGSAP